MSSFWDGAVSGKSGKELAKALDDAGITDGETLDRYANDVQRISKDVFADVAHDLLAKALKAKAGETGEIAWGSLRGFSTGLEDDLYAKGIFTIEHLQTRFTLAVRVIANSRGGDFASLAQFAQSSKDKAEAQPIITKENES